MNLREALKQQFDTDEEVETAIKEMIAEIDAGADPDNLLEDYGLEPDYTIELLEECF